MLCLTENIAFSSVVLYTTWCIALKQCCQYGNASWYGAHVTYLIAVRLCVVCIQIML